MPNDYKRMCSHLTSVIEDAISAIDAGRPASSIRLMLYASLLNVKDIQPEPEVPADKK